jgi:AbrB family looped-hinge helix DNA binding protein
MDAADEVAQTITMSTKGQVVIPQGIRELVGFHAGDRLEVRVHGGIVELRKQRDPRDALQAFFATRRVKWKPGEVEAILTERHA